MIIQLRQNSVSPTGYPYTHQYSQWTPLPRLQSTEMKWEYLNSDVLEHPHEVIYTK